MNFTIPSDVNNDILYCQKSLRHYIHVHQMLAASLHSKNVTSDPRLAELENEISEIGREQKKTVDQLRLYMENYFVCLEKSNLSIDRATANTNVANQLFQNFQTCYDKVEPINVTKRLTDSELLERYIYNYPATSGSATARAITFPEANKPEKMEVLLSPNDVMFQNVSDSPVPQKAQVSLLKPKSERLVPVSPKSSIDEQCQSTSAAATSSANLNSRRLNLLQVLKTKAKNQNIEQDDKTVKKVDNSVNPAAVTVNSEPSDDVEIIEMPPIETVVVSNSPGSSSATSLSGDTFDGPDLPEEEEEPTTLGKEAFLRVVGLCTHTYHDYLKTRRSERKRRNCTSTEKRDFHYGKIDILFERQSTRATKRVFLKSTPEPRPIITKTRRKPDVSSSKKPKIESKSTSSSSSSLYDDMKLCISCLKNNSSEKILECESCNVHYHLSCHETVEATSIHSQRIKNRFCPDCLQRQQKTREKNAAQQRGLKFNKILMKQRQLTMHRQTLVEELLTLEQRMVHECSSYEVLQMKNKKLQDAIAKILEPINALTGRSLQFKDLEIKS